MTFSNDSTHPLLAGGLANKSFNYYNDIDHSMSLGPGSSVLASGVVNKDNCSVTTPALVAIDPLLVTTSIP